MKRLTHVALFAVLLVVSACRDLTIAAPPPPPGPGTIQGTLVYAEPGRSTFVPAAGATVRLMDTGLTVTADAEGRFVLGNVRRSTGTLLLSLKVDTVVRQKTLRLEDIRAGAGRDIALGQVVLARNALVRGRITLDDRAGSTTGLGGVTVFVPSGPWSSVTADDGSYSLIDLPEGALQMAYFRTEYAVSSLDVALSPGDERVLPTVQLKRAPQSPASVKGLVVKGDQSPASDATIRIRASGIEQAIAISSAGVFQKEILTPGVYSFAIERTGSLSIALYNVLLTPGENDLGTIQMFDGPGTTIDLHEADPMVSMSVDGGQVDGGQVDGGQTDAGQVDGGQADGGQLDAGQADAGDASVGDAGSPDAGPVPDAGYRPVAIATGPETAASGTKVTLSGSASSGDFPLIYRWSQIAGTPVTLDVNNSALAHSPQFTAPAAGTIVELQLIVEDRGGLISAPTTVRVGIGVRPVARFIPDSGTVVYGGQVVPLTSTSIDDAGVVLAFFDWRLSSGTPGTLISDGGPSALWQTVPVTFGNPDVLGGVTLQVTNGIGAKSNATTNFYTVRGIASSNWTVDAGATQSIAVGTSPPQVQLTASVSAPLISNPQYTVAWNCTPALSLVGADTLTPRFVSPVVNGPTQIVDCSVTLTGSAPLDPPTITGTTSVLLRDTAAPVVVRSNVEPTRMGRFGFFVITNERLSSADFGSPCGTSYGFSTRLIHGGAVSGPNYGVLTDNGTCSSFLVDLRDVSPAQNFANNAAFATGAATITPEWTGPYVSSSSFDDPRPLVASLSQLPTEVQKYEGVTAGTTPGYELVALQGSNLVQFAGLNLSTRPTCNPSCALTDSLQNLNLPAGTVPDVRRGQFGGAELFVTARTDGGVAPIALRRSPNGTWSSFAGLTGTPGNWNLELRTVHADDAGQLLVDTWSPSLQKFTTTDIAATGVTDSSVLATSMNSVVAVVGAQRNILIRKRNSANLTWSTFNGSPHSNVLSLKIDEAGALSLVVLEEGPPSNVLVVQRFDSGGIQTVTSGAVVGYDMVSQGQISYVVYAQNGDIHFEWINGAVWSGAGGGFTDFGGPPRPGFSAPYPVVLDANPACEAAYPTATFIEDGLVIAWQERCSPATKWNVVVRVLR